MDRRDKMKNKKADKEVKVVGIKIANESILATLAYGDVFDYPLRRDEVFHYLIIKRSVEKGIVLKSLAGITTDSKQIDTDGEYYFLKGREETVGLRKTREKWSKKKIKKAKKIARLLKLIPTVKLVGISGALAMGNADEEDDIDLFIVASSGRLWLTRFLVTVLVELTGQRRRPFSSYHISHITYHIKDRICLNMFVDEDHLAVPSSERNLFTAHEVVQMRPLWERDDVYQRFLGENGWVREWLGNAMENEKLKIKKEKSLNISISQYLNIFGLLEKIAFWAQVRYMEKRRTTEKISPGRILFHPENKSKWVMGEYRKRIANLSE